MKRILFSLAVLATSIVSSQVLIDDTNTVETPTTGAVLDLNSVDKGLLMPRLSNQDVSALEVEGMVYYDVEMKCFRGWNGDVWVALGGVCLDNDVPAGETYTETFENIPTDNNGSYSTRTWIGDQELSWTATKARTDQTIDGIDGKAITIQGIGRLTTTIPNGISELTLTTQRKFTGGSGNLTVYINGVSVGVIPYGGNVQTTTISNINTSGDVELEIYVPNDRVAMDNLTWTTNP